MEGPLRRLLREVFPRPPSSFAFQEASGPVNFKVEERDTYTLVEFEIVGGVLEPSDLKRITPPQVNYQKGVVISGRGPIWLYCFLAHAYHPTKFVATFDPQLGGAVVVETHTKDVEVGDVIPV